MAKVQDSSNLYTPNLFIVDASGHSPFLTIQSAITAATDMGKTAVEIYIRPGTYTENLTLVAAFDLIGENRDSVVINGTHVVPAAGQIYMHSITFAQPIPATDIFTEAGAGTCNIRFWNCYFNLNSGCLLNLPTSTGIMTLKLCDDGSTANSIVINNAGATFVAENCNIGNGAVAGTITGSAQLRSSGINVPLNFETTGVLLARGTRFTEALTFSDTYRGNFYHCSFYTGGSTPITVNAGTIVVLDNVVIESSAANIVTGAGTAIYGELTATDSFTHNATTETYTTRVITGSLQLDETVAGVLYGTAGVIGSTAALTNGELLVGNTGNPPSVATLTSGAGITVTNGAGTISVASNAPMTRADIAADGALSVNTSYTNTKAGLLTVTLPDGTANDEIVLIGDGAGGWIIDQTDAAHQIFVGNTNTTLGVAGSLASTNNGDCVSIRCLSAKTWRVFSMVGNLTVV